MAFFRVGMRVKKVRGKRGIGDTAVVIGTFKIARGDYNPFTGREAVIIKGFISDLQVQNEKPWLNGENVLCPAEKPALTKAELWEPILPPHEPADDAEFIKDLDRLLEKVGDRV